MEEEFQDLSARNFDSVVKNLIFRLPPSSYSHQTSMNPFSWVIPNRDGMVIISGKLGRGAASSVGGC